MLSQLSIKNYATVDSLEIEFRSGMSVITGETGAGKSIMLGALGLTLGDRADKTIVRPGASKAEICAEFDTANIPNARAWLSDNDLEDEGNGDENNCILRRLVGADGRSKAYINGSLVTLANLKTLGEMLLDIHSQHEHQSLLKRSTHQRLLDDYGVKAKLLAELESTWRQWQKNFQSIEQLSNQSEEDSAQFQLLSYQLTELDELEIITDEVSSLEHEFKSLNHADETIGAVQQAFSLASENEQGNASSLLHQSLSTLQELAEKDERISSIIKLLETAGIQLDEAVADLRSFADEFEANPQRLETVNARLSLLHGVARKHKVKPTELSQLIEGLRQQLSLLENSEEELEKLQANDELLRSQYQQLASEVSRQRKKASSSLTKKVNQQLNLLGMPHAQVELCLSSNDSDKPSIHGLETVEFLVCTNPGQDAGPLIKIASGGELSRISLAIQVITAQTSHTPSLVFDEVDVGIGGGVAKVVGELLKQLAASTQILCVTHQAQVAGQGNHHFFVSKSSEGDSTLTRINALSAEEKIRELARMLGGEVLDGEVPGGKKFSAESLAHAQQMVANS